jgi:FtsH-binding integral membrane protein
MYPVYDNTIDNNINNYNNNTNNYTSFDQFKDKRLRKKFVRNTLFTFSLSLFTTLGFCIGFKNIPTIDTFVKSEVGEALYILSVSTTFLTMFVCLCCEDLLRKTPSKYIIYSLFVLAVSYSLGISSLYIKGDVLYISIIITTGTTISLILYSFIATTDFTEYYTYLVAIFMCLIFIGIVNIFFNNTIIQVIISGGGTLVFACFIVFDMQMILGQKHIKYKYSIDDFILAAMSLYLDVINMFLYIIQFLTLTSSD